MRLAQPLTNILRLFPPPQHRPLPAHGIQAPALLIEPELVGTGEPVLAPLVVAGGPVAQGVGGVEGGPVGDAVVPGAADFTDPVDAVVHGPAVAGAGRDAGRLVVRVREAEVRQHVRRVLVRVVVFPLQVVGLAGAGRRDRWGGGFGAEAIGARQVVARVRGGGAACEAGDLAELDLEGGGGVEEGREEEGRKEAEGAH